MPALGSHEEEVCLQAALYCSEEQEGPLLQYLASARDLLGRPLYDPQTALRLARQRNKLQACVQLLCDLNLYEVSTTHPQHQALYWRVPCTALQAVTLTLYSRHLQLMPRLSDEAAAAALGD